MEKIGDCSSQGFSLVEITLTKTYFESRGFTCELHDLLPGISKEIRDNESIPAAFLLIIRQGASAFFSNETTTKELQRELSSLTWDTKAKMYGRVVNKHKRHNLCFADYSQDPDYEEGKGRVVSFADLPLLSSIRTGLGSAVGPSAENLLAEGNLYYDASKCGIGFHGDSERRKVVGLRLGETLPLVYAWYKNWNVVGTPMRFDIADGDLYIMSDKAVGNDWKRQTIYTLRHAAGCDECIKL
jgi:alkylated DNA repair dioxygenase AlkB